MNRGVFIPLPAFAPSSVRFRLAAGRDTRGGLPFDLHFFLVTTELAVPTGHPLHTTCGWSYSVHPPGTSVQPEKTAFRRL